MKSFEEFKEILREEIAGNVDGDVTIVTIPKNNGVKLDALSIKNSTNNIAPIIYLDSYYKDYNNGRSIDSIVDSIVTICTRESGVSSELINQFTDYSLMKDYIQVKLINKERNAELLKTVPHREFLDLAIVCMLNIPFSDEQGEGTVLINRHHMEIWSVSEDEMFSVAKVNSLEKNPAVIKSMNDVIKDMYISNVLEEQEEDELFAMIDSADSYLYVLTNTSKHNGAVAITYENVLKDFANTKNCNLYILPSSIHEVIIVPEKDKTKTTELREMVQSVNQTELQEIEILSDNVYYYDRELDKITIA